MRFKLAGCFYVLFASLLLWGQGTDLGTLRGIVSDASGAVIPNAAVTVTDLATQTTQQTLTNNEGAYEVFGLRPGDYKVLVSAPSFGTTEITGIRLTGSAVVSANAVLNISGTAEAVTVSSEAPLIHTEDQTISQTLSNRAVVELPRDSRDVYSFLYLNPNITQGPADGEFKFLGSAELWRELSHWTASAPMAVFSAAIRPASLRLKRSAK